MGPRSHTASDLDSKSKMATVRGGWLAGAERAVGASEPIVSRKASNEQESNFIMRCWYIVMALDKATGAARDEVRAGQIESS